MTCCARRKKERTAHPPKRPRWSGFRRCRAPAAATAPLAAAAFPLREAVGRPSDLAPFAAAPLLRPRVGAVADLPGIDGDGLGSRISVAQLRLHAGDDLRQMRADEFTARLFVPRGAIEAGKHV